MSNKSKPPTNQIKQVEQTFRKVSVKIDGLINCSVKDFVLLNNAFKNYHSLIQTIEKATKEYQATIESNELFSLLQAHHNSFELALSQFDTIITKQLTLIKERSDKYTYILLCSKNIRQNLSTIQLLFTNLRFDPSISLDHSEMIRCYQALHQYFIDIEESVQQQNTLVLEIINFHKQQFNSIFDNCSNATNRLKNQLANISGKKTANKIIAEQLKKIEKKKLASTSEIITNLQFQDILRQKIEHIQEAQEHITKKLYFDHKPDNSITQKELLQIRDISALQSALLVHANQEYQTAVENIVKRINELKQVKDKFSILWDQVCIPEKTRQINQLTQTESEFDLLVQHSLKVSEFNDNYKKLILSLTKENSSAREINKNNEIISEEIKNLQRLICQSETITSSKEYSPVSQLLDECEKINSGYKKLSVQINELYTNNIEQFNAEIEDSSKQIKEIVAQSKASKSVIQDYSQELNENELNPQSESAFPDFNVDQVSYYKTFEKEVKEIVDLLDGLLEKINLRKEELDPNKLEHLKEMYTMESERVVHDSLSKNKNKDKTKDSTTDDEVEFF